MKIDFDGIQAFVVTAELGGFNKAAEQLHITQTALTRRVQKLETYLGCSRGTCRYGHQNICKKIMSERVGAVVARGDAELGFQQVSELIYFKELDFIGTLPESVQQTIFFSAGLVEGSTEQETSKQLIRFFQSPEVAETIRQTGLDPVAAR